MENLKIAITGKMGSGKSSLTKIIKDLEDGYVTSFSSVIRKVIIELDLQPTRELMQATGDFFREFDKLVWTKQVLKEIKNINKTCIIEGIRYPFERDELAAQGFIILKLIANEDIRRQRIENRNQMTIDDKTWLSWTNHSTEQYVDQIKAEYILRNNDSQEMLFHSTVKILHELKEKLK